MPPEPVPSGCVDQVPVQAAVVRGEVWCHSKGKHQDDVAKWPPIHQAE